ncbi:DUF4249 domain-containing protein [Flavobacteriaceae bacterium]|jgi:hypothetical protein|nr:DUF4249 domain-containing protein [Flavobacteriaceae bacterium]|tara:strand:+ start:5610 stop:6449 length:840 start_codon:yes stop_codon:yes gene_type:complete
MRLLKLIILIIIFHSCEKVIDIETEFDDKRLVIDANISKHRDSIDGIASVKLSETIPYFSDQESIVKNASVKIETNQIVYNLVYNNDKKEYSSIIENINKEEFVLSIIRNENTYTSSEKLITTPKIKSVIFGDRKSLNKDEVELRVTFIDPPEKGNYYLWKFGPKKSGKYDYLPALDKYINGNEFTFSFFIDKTEYLQNSDFINIEINGISENYYNYLNILTSQAGAQNGRPFSTSSSIIRGNISNLVSEEKFPLGYFRVYEFDYFRLSKDDAPDGVFD